MNSYEGGEVINEFVIGGIDWGIVDCEIIFKWGVNNYFILVMRKNKYWIYYISKFVVWCLVGEIFFFV